MCVEQEGGTWGRFEGDGGTPCVFAERRNINNTGKAKREGASYKKEIKCFQGFNRNCLVSLHFTYSLTTLFSVPYDNKYVLKHDAILIFVSVESRL
jgi:hypothetical protein